MTTGINLEATGTDTANPLRLGTVERKAPQMLWLSGNPGRSGCKNRITTNDFQTPSLRYDLLCGAVVSLFIGGAIYLLWRDDSLLMFMWVDAIGVQTLLEPLRAQAKRLEFIASSWIALSLPGALWSYSFAACLSCIWYASRKMLIVSVMLVVLVAVGGEVSQYAGWIPGTFSVADLALNGTAVCCASLQVKNFHPQGGRSD